MRKILILESRFTNHQKTHILLTIGAIPLIALTYSVIRKYNLTIISLSVIVYALLICLTLTKKGLIRKDSKLFKGLFFKNKLLFKKEFDLTGKTKITTLKLNKSQKMAWFSNAKPDMGFSFESLDITLLNDKHTVKELIISLKQVNSKNNAVKFLTEEFGLKNEIYSPDFS